MNDDETERRIEERNRLCRTLRAELLMLGGMLLAAQSAKRPTPTLIAVLRDVTAYVVAANRRIADEIRRNIRV